MTSREIVTALHRLTECKNGVVTMESSLLATERANHSITV